MSRNMLGGLAIVVALGFTLLVPSQAHARRRCCNGWGNNGGMYTSSGTTYAAPANSPCAGNPGPTNPDGSLAPQPSNSPSAAPAAPPAPSPAPPSASATYRRFQVRVTAANL
jgi:hypothetical protein